MKKIIITVAILLQLSLNAQDWPYSNGYIYFGTNTLDQSQAGNYALLQQKSDGSTFLNSPSKIFMRIGNQTKFCISNNGNLGIGTTSPQHKMEVYGSNNAIGVGLTNYGWANTNLIGSEYGAWDNSRTNATGTYFYRWTGTGTSYHLGYIGQEQELNNGHWGLAFKTDSENSKTHATSTRMFIDITGDVGIGTTSPDAKLAVNGNIHTKEVKVDLVGWPDYVFEKEYNLPSLEEVETHIEENGHLQDIPSAEEVEENGIKLGEMNSKLLQKIEELMLYTIQQQKEIKKLRENHIQLLADVQALKQNTRK